MKYSNLFSRKYIIRYVLGLLSFVQFCLSFEGCESKFGYSPQNYDAINDLKIDPDNGDILYAATTEGLYKSSNGAGVWSEILDESSHAIAINPINPDTLYSIGWRNISKSGNAGLSWQVLDIPFSRSFSRNLLKLDAINNRTLYASDGKELFRSNDKGESWISLISKDIVDIAIDHSLQGIIYIGGEDGLFKSKDSGATWTKMDEGIKGTIQVLELDPLDSETLFCGTSSGLFKTSNRAKAWAETSLSSSIFSIRIARGNTNLIYACGRRELFKSEDGGLIWNEIELVSPLTHPNFSITTIQLDPDNSDILYLGTFERGVIKSINGGKTWGVKKSGLPLEPPLEW